LSPAINLSGARPELLEGLKGDLKEYFERHCRKQKRTQDEADPCIPGVNGIYSEISQGFKSLGDTGINTMFVRFFFVYLQ
jgi:hypothetical protein